MLVGTPELYISSAFEKEAELEAVAQRHAELLFGSGIIYSPQTQVAAASSKRFPGEKERRCRPN